MNPRHEDRFVVPRQVQPPNRVNRVHINQAKEDESNQNQNQGTQRKQPKDDSIGQPVDSGSDLEKALRYRDVDKKEIKSALEIKLDKFDKIDEKYADYAKKVKEN